ncbi:FadR family transcriptional regulator [Vibrio vulnificus]|uniref:FadR/GntR family transcriptional regulator n=1 Tax=Vibrio vulnificus TaxID=672 RepID=UPI0005F17F0B|nr:FCD domain-containing protein [Vibrio vulnificus]EGQ7953845.1 FadR family transcriptional regulator [Vibrio vulnificus]EGQ7988279.1 FadR family transcriptional regulator [Vibrio vulnificus]EGQ8174249.1 FadR family transcriptional regulator [Vibrio vulnificus]EGQ9235789.1 FadR family transcriptional regulator [Vibrio vulnificus]EGR0088099.1 FadR family transcriptional regulator [Vibrio vulnificus]
MALTKTQIVANHLAEKILKGHYLPGDSIAGENELATTLGVSRTSIRAAIQILAGKGILSTVAKMGTIVNERNKWNWLDIELLRWISEFDVDHELIPSLMEARLIFEPNIAALAALNATPRDLVALEEGYELMVKGEKTDDRDLFNQGDIKFHKALIASSNNCFLLSMGDALTTALGMAFKHTLEQEVELTAPAIKMHFDLMEAVRMRDVEKARSVMRNIIMDAIGKTIGKDVTFPQFIL